MNNDMRSKGNKLTESEGSILSVLLGVIICVVLLQAGPAAAAEELLPDGFMLRFGGYRVSNAETIMRLDANNAPVGAYIDFSETLGGDTSTTVVRMDGLYRFNNKHGLGLSWYALKFTGSRTLSTPIDWGGQTFSSQVDSELKFDVYKLNYQYSLLHNKEAELGVLVGFHVMRVSAGISASGIGESKAEAVTAPLPVFGFYADYNFTPRFSAFYNYQFFFVNYQDKIKGGLQDFLLGLEYRLFRNFALGAAYNRFALQLDVVGDATTLNVKTNWNGGLLYGALYF